MANPKRLLLPVVYCLGIFALSSIHGDQPDTSWGQLFMWVKPQWQNLLHIPLFGGLAACWFWALACWRSEFWNRALAAALLTLLYSGFDEWYQLSVPGRFGSWTDLMLNALGVMLALLWIGRQQRSSSLLR